MAQDNVQSCPRQPCGDMPRAKPQNFPNQEELQQGQILVKQTYWDYEDFMNPSIPNPPKKCYYKVMSKNEFYKRQEIGRDLELKRPCILKNMEDHNDSEFPNHAAACIESATSGEDEDDDEEGDYFSQESDEEGSGEPSLIPGGNQFQPSQYQAPPLSHGLQQPPSSYFQPPTQFQGPNRPVPSQMPPRYQIPNAPHQTTQHYQLQPPQWQSPCNPPPQFSDLNSPQPLNLLDQQTQRERRCNFSKSPSPSSFPTERSVPPHQLQQQQQQHIRIKSPSPCRSPPPGFAYPGVGQNGNPLQKPISSQDLTDNGRVQGPPLRMSSNPPNRGPPLYDNNNIRKPVSSHNLNGRGGGVHNPVHPNRLPLGNQPRRSPEIHSNQSPPMEGRSISPSRYPVLPNTNVYSSASSSSTSTECNNSEFSSPLQNYQPETNQNIGPQRDYKTNQLSQPVPKSGMVIRNRQQNPNVAMGNSLMENNQQPSQPLPNGKPSGKLVLGNVQACGRTTPPETGLTQSLPGNSYQDQNCKTCLHTPPNSQSQHRTSRNSQFPSPFLNGSPVPPSSTHPMNSPPQAHLPCSSSNNKCHGYLSQRNQPPHRDGCQEGPPQRNQSPCCPSPMSTGDRCCEDQSWSKPSCPTSPCPEECRGCPSLKNPPTGPSSPPRTDIYRGCPPPKNQSSFPPLPAGNSSRGNRPYVIDRYRGGGPPPPQNQSYSTPTSQQCSKESSLQSCCDLEKKPQPEQGYSSNDYNGSNFTAQQSCCDQPTFQDSQCACDSIEIEEQSCFDSKEDCPCEDQSQSQCFTSYPIGDEDCGSQSEVTDDLYQKQNSSFSDHEEGCDLYDDYGATGSGEESDFCGQEDVCTCDDDKNDIDSKNNSDNKHDNFNYRQEIPQPPCNVTSGIPECANNKVQIIIQIPQQFSNSSSSSPCCYQPSLQPIPSQLQPSQSFGPQTQTSQHTQSLKSSPQISPNVSQPSQPLIQPSIKPPQMPSHDPQSSKQTPDSPSQHSQHVCQTLDTPSQHSQPPSCTPQSSSKDQFQSPSQPSQPISKPFQPQTSPCQTLQSQNCSLSSQSFHLQTSQGQSFQTHSSQPLSQSSQPQLPPNQIYQSTSQQCQQHPSPCQPQPHQLQSQPCQAHQQLRQPQTQCCQLQISQQQLRPCQPLSQTFQQMTQPSQQPMEVCQSHSQGGQHQSLPYQSSSQSCQLPLQHSPPCQLNNSQPYQSFHHPIKYPPSPASANAVSSQQNVPPSQFTNPYRQPSENSQRYSDTTQHSGLSFNFNVESNKRVNHPSLDSIRPPIPRIPSMGHDSPEFNHGYNNNNNSGISFNRQQFLNGAPNFTQGLPFLNSRYPDSGDKFQPNPNNVGCCQPVANSIRMEMPPPCDGCGGVTEPHCRPCFQDSNFNNLNTCGDYGGRRW